jgi:hypothetical protein
VSNTGTRAGPSELVGFILLTKSRRLSVGGDLGPRAAAGAAGPVLSMAVQPRAPEVFPRTSPAVGPPPAPGCPAFLQHHPCSAAAPYRCARHGSWLVCSSWYLPAAEDVACAAENHSLTAPRARKKRGRRAFGSATQRQRPRHRRLRTRHIRANGGPASHYLPGEREPRYGLLSCDGPCESCPGGSRSGRVLREVTHRRRLCRRLPRGGPRSETRRGWTDRSSGRCESLDPRRRRSLPPAVSRRA